jgi:uncharacterized 2Fe-2S/4Fe-4S cluster protein (DUF4445 family)
LLNPQTNFGGDVISRINYTSQNEDGLQELQGALIRSINRQLDHFAELVGIGRNDIVKITIAGNTTMLHLLLAKDPLPIALAPFVPHFTDAQLVNAQKLGLCCNPEAEVTTLPCVSAYVGADIVAGIASVDVPEAIGNYLFMDVGTNGEMAVVTPDRIWCCATAAGPAFEGDRITHGMTATEGAISTFGEEGYTVIGDIAPIGICGSGLIDIVAYLLENNMIDAEGLIMEDYVIASAKESAREGAIVLNQQDIREVQLAKSAIAAGVNVLLKEAGLTHDDIDAVFLAGGFGNYINAESAMRIGLISPAFKDKVIALGNTSGTGAIQAMKSTKFDEVVEAVIDRTTYIELSENEDFTMDFAMNMMFND